jgi:hypothetical protein
MSPSFREADDITRFASGDHFAADDGTARSRCRPGRARSTGCPGAATAGSTSPSKRRVISGRSVQCDADHGHAECSQDLVPQ